MNLTENYLKQRDKTNPPRLRVPKRACDCHAHIFGDPARFPFAAPRSYTPVRASEAEYQRMLDTLGVERMVIVQPSVYGLDNRCTLAAVEALGVHRTRAVAMLDASVTDAELHRLDAAGVRGVRFITMAKGGASLDDLEVVAKRIAPFGWHIQTYVKPEVWRDLYPLLARLPVQVVIDHMGHVTPDRRLYDPGVDAISRLLDTGRAWIKLIAYRVSLAGPPYYDVKPIAQAFLRRAPERCLWGSDWPHPDLAGYMPDDGDLLDLLLDWAPNADLRKRILVDNPASLYGFMD